MCAQEREKDMKTERRETKTEKKVCKAEAMKEETNGAAGKPMSPNLNQRVRGLWRLHGGQIGLVGLSGSSYSWCP